MLIVKLDRKEIVKEKKTWMTNATDNGRTLDKEKEICKNSFSKVKYHSNTANQQSTLLTILLAHWVFIYFPQLCQTFSRRSQHNGISRHTMVTRDLRWLGSVLKGCFILLIRSTCVQKYRINPIIPPRKGLCAIKSSCLLLIFIESLDTALAYRCPHSLKT